MIRITEAAGRKVRELQEREGKQGQALRVFVAGGGCAGFQYGLAFDDQPTEDDWVVEEAGVQLYVDAMSALHLSGAEIDYRETLMESGFVIENPNAVASCSCGHSFRTAEEAGSAQANGGGCCSSH